jgi:hypothetical protein
MKITGILIFLILITGCDKLPEPLSTNGAISGDVYADSSGREVYGIKVKATGPYGENSLVTQNESYKLEGLGNGTYDLEFSKEGYGTIHQYGLQVFGDETVYAASARLFSVPTITLMPRFIKAYPVKVSNSPFNHTNVKIEMAVTNTNPWGLPIILLMSNSRDVAWNNFEFFYPGNTGYTGNPLPYLYVSTNLPFEHGSEVFIRGYLGNPKECSSGGYLDTYHGRIVFSTLDKSMFTNIVSFIMP